MYTINAGARLKIERCATQRSRRTTLLRSARPLADAATLHLEISGGRRGFHRASKDASPSGLEVLDLLRRGLLSSQNRIRGVVKGIERSLELWNRHWGETVFLRAL